MVEPPERDGDGFRLHAKWSMLRFSFWMLEAVHTDLVFTISLKRSTQNPELSTSRRPITPS
jgi:hypothetical protein